MNQIVNITYVRHGFSCSNLASSLRDFQDLKIDHIEDPALTLHGIQKTLKVSSEIKANLKARDLYPDVESGDIIGSSQLLRAIETSLLLFKDEIIDQKWQTNVVPFIIESGNHISNRVVDKDMQLTIMRNTPAFKDFDLKSNQPDVIWRTDQTTKLGDVVVESNYDKFLDWVASNIILRDGLKIVLVSHGNFIGEHVLKTSYILDNNDCANVRYSVITVNGKKKLVPMDYEWIWRSENESESQFVQRISCDSCSEF